MFTKAFESVGRMLGFNRQADEDERRVWGRLRCNLETTCRPAGHGPDSDTPVHIHNISAGGVGVTSARGYTPGSLLSLALPNDGKCVEPTRVLMCVVRCDLIEGGRFSLGCTFAAVLEDEDLARFGARRVKSGPTDKRQWVRFGCRAQVNYQVVRTPAPSEASEAEVRDISAGGIRLLLTNPVRVGDLLSLDLVRDEQVVLTTLASVVRTESSPEGQIVGCNFIRELSDEILERLA